MIGTYPHLAEKGKEIQKLWPSNKKAFYYEIACWVTDDLIVWEDFKVTPLPQPPELVREYLGMPEEIRKKNVKGDFFNEKEVKEYFDLREKVCNRNSSYRRFLEQALVALPIEDKERRDKITNLIFDYRERGF